MAKKTRDERDFQILKGLVGRCAIGIVNCLMEDDDLLADSEDHDPQCHSINQGWLPRAFATHYTETFFSALASATMDMSNKICSAAKPRGFKQPNSNAEELALRMIKMELLDLLETGQAYFLRAEDVILPTIRSQAISELLEDICDHIELDGDIYALFSSQKWEREYGQKVFSPNRWFEYFHPKKQPRSATPILAETFLEDIAGVAEST